MEMIMDIVSYLTMAVTVASAIAATTPTPKDDELVGKLYKFIDLLAINIGKAKQQASTVESKDGNS
jgi:hypothetical protein|tara:strand:+ start:2201 stop:2398 length:198 start_codon:yes stop_codon:yes gene_type:complete